jgi:gamma-glutamyltranspeptidase
MSPAIVLDGNGDAVLVLGASGGTKITTAVAMVRVPIVLIESKEQFKKVIQ